jgi:hypothetical protein
VILAFVYFVFAQCLFPIFFFNYFVGILGGTVCMIAVYDTQIEDDLRA